MQTQDQLADLDQPKRVDFVSGFLPCAVALDLRVDAGATSGNGLAAYVRVCQKPQLPIASLQRSIECATSEIEQISSGHLPMSPPPALPPSVPLSLWEVLPVEPPASPPQLQCEGDQTRLAGNAVQDHAVSSAWEQPRFPKSWQFSLAAVLPPSAPAAFPQSAAAPAQAPPTAPPALPGLVLCEAPWLTVEATKEASGSLGVELPNGSPHVKGSGSKQANDAVACQAQRQSSQLTPFPPGLSPPPGTPSHGSVLHATGQCRPCTWFWKPSGCKNGEECGHCHLCPDGEIRSRKKAKQHMMNLGLATPQAEGLFDDGRKGRFAMECEPADAALHLHMDQDAVVACIGSDQESTTGTSSDRELTSCTDQDDFSAGEAQSSPTLTSHAAVVAGTPNAGSILHGMGNCHPCAWFWKSVGCQNDQQCRYCHLCPEDTLKARKKSKMAMMRSGLALPMSNALSGQKARHSLSLACLL